MSAEINDFATSYIFTTEQDFDIPRSIFEDDNYNITLLSGEADLPCIQRDILELINRYGISYKNLATIIDYNLKHKFSNNTTAYNHISRFKFNLHLVSNPDYVKKNPLPLKDFIKVQDKKYNITRSDFDLLKALSAPTCIGTQVDRTTESPAPQQVQNSQPKETTTSKSAFSGVGSVFGNNNNKSNTSSRTSSSVKIVTPSEERKSVPPQHTLSISSHPFSQPAMSSSTSKSVHIVEQPLAIGSPDNLEPIPHSRLRHRHVVCMHACCMQYASIRDRVLTVAYIFCIRIHLRLQRL